MNGPVVRLSSLQLVNIKNVKNGIIIMPNRYKKTRLASSADILGIYGQNGSGKTAIVDALYFLRMLMTGSNIEQSLAEYISVDSNFAELSAYFDVIMDNIAYEVKYSVHFIRNEREVVVEHESLSVRKVEDCKEIEKSPFMIYQRDQADIIFKPENELSEIMKKDPEIITDLVVAKKMAEKRNTSYIFGEDTREIFCSRHCNEFGIKAKVIGTLYGFAQEKLIVIRNFKPGIIPYIVIPGIYNSSKRNVTKKEESFITLNGVFLVNQEQKTYLDMIIKQINPVVSNIIPGFHISIKDYGNQVLDDGTNGWEFELISHREGKNSFPIRMESNGIIKLISILFILIQAFNDFSMCIVIDDLDSNIFEYLFGELLMIFQNHAKGQLIFTAHDFRALEMLEKENFMFSTINPDNRYIHMENIEENNNIRSIYFRNITLEGQSEAIYQKTDNVKIARAFKKAKNIVL